MSSPSAVSGEQRLREEVLVRKHLPLVDYAVNDVATRVPRHVARADLMSAGLEGLAQAARSFDPARGIPFDRYATSRIRGALLDELRHRDWASRSVRAKARRVNAVSDELTVKLGRTPTAGEVASAADMDHQTVNALHEDLHRAVVLNFEGLAKHGSVDEIMPADKRGPDAILLERERQAYLHAAIGALDDRLRHVVIGFFFEERPMQELADELGVTESRISQMRAEALLLLRDGMNSQLDPDILPPDPESPRVAKRKAAYYAAVAAGSDYRTRLSEPARQVVRIGADISA